ncbi:Scr1 family TA system antitoxin-like transcriptional regulator [Spirillospora sp. NPDC048911]|uniref:Scr1 family TA system antitoxin-like transcriptional regulator n=1 Tax=Spirillospora sp. NPDC048911 TaxID=3364527 RepID=UPI003719F8FC
MDMSPAMHRTIVCIDVEGFGDRRRRNFDQGAVRAAMYQALTDACAGSGVSWRECYHEDRGDGVLVLVSPEVPKSYLVTSFPQKLAMALAAHNRKCTPQTRIRLRLAVHAGEVHYDRYGVVGNAINLTFRLLETPQLKAGLADSPTAVALISSRWFFEEVIQHTPAAGAERYHPVQVLVKETRTDAWMRLIDHGDSRDELPGAAWNDLLSAKAKLCLELEGAARLIRGYELHAVPELLQTADYARATLRFEYPGVSRDGITRRVDLLMRRQRILHGSEPCRLWVVIDEGALRRRCSSAVMRQQLAYLIEMSRLRHITIQIMPLSAGVAAGGALTLLRFPAPETADAVYLETLSRGLYLDRPADVEHYQQVMYRLCVLAAQPDDTTAFLHRIMREI